jgi:hypothetical protein
MEISREQYQYIWYSLYRLTSEDKGAEKIYFKVSSKISPYMELNMQDINYESIEKDYILETNPFYRFTHVFNEFMNPDLQMGNKLKDEMLNILLHMLGNLDLQDGLNKRMILNRIIIRELEEGRYGEEIQEYFGVLNRREKIIIADGIQDKYKYEREWEIFKKVMSKMYKDSIIYDSIDEQEKVIIYINKKKSADNKKKYLLIEKLFMPLGLKSRCFWGAHFPVLGVEEVMKIGEMVIF